MQPLLFAVASVLSAPQEAVDVPFVYHRTTILFEATISDRTVVCLLDTGAEAIPSRLQTLASMEGGAVAWVPTGPEIWPTAITSRAWVRRFWARRTSSHHNASLRPNVMGSACTP